MLLASFALAATAAATPPVLPQTTFAAGAEVVRLDVVVTDPAGRPLRDLRPQDFEVLEDGALQRVLYFRRVSATRGATPSAPAGETSTAAPSGEVEAFLPRRLVFAIDDLHLSASHLLIARRDVARFLREELDPEDEVALVTTSGALGLRQRLTRDRGAILAALERIGVQDRSSRFRQEKPYISEGQAEQIGSDGSLSEASRSFGSVGDQTSNEAFELAVAQFHDELGVDRRTAEQMTLERVREILAEGAQYTLSVCTTLEDVIKSLGALPGRKAIVLLSDGFQLGTGTHYQSYFDPRRLTDAATRAGVVVHAIDVGGLSAPTPTGDVADRSSTRERRSETPMFSMRLRVETFADASRREGMKRIADETGGLTVFNNNDLTFGLRRVRDDGNDYYLLAYEPSHTAHDGRFRALSVRVPGRGGKLKVRTRRGYFAPRDSSKPPVPGGHGEGADHELRAALESVAPLPGLAVEVQADFVDLAQAGPAALVRTRVATAAKHLDLAFRIVDGAGAVAAQGSETVERAGEGASKAEIDYEKSFPLPPGRYEIVVVARGDGSGKVGSGFASVEILEGTGGGVALREPPAVAVERLRAALAASEPRQDFVHQAGALHFAAKEGERESIVLVQVPLGDVTLTPDEASQRYHAHLMLLALIKDASGKLVTSLSHDWPLEGPLDEIEGRRRGRATFRHILRLAPGRYVLETAIQDRQSERLSVERIPFEVPAVGPGIALSSLTIVRRTEVVAEVKQTEDPLRVGRIQVAPEIGPNALSAKNAELTYFLTVYPAPGPDPVEIGLEFRRQGLVVARAAPALPAANPEGRIPFIGRAPLGALGPGVYELVAAVRQGAAVAEERASFEIPPPASPVLVQSPRPGIVPREIAEVLEKAAHYVAEYERTFRDLVAEEDYRQQYAAGALPSGAPGPPSGGLSGPLDQWADAQRTRADLVFARLPGDTWGSFRDVFEVDGRKVHDRDARLEKLFGTNPASAPERAGSILRESARYNIGGLRNINLPTLPLQFLRPKTGSGFSFKRGGHRRFAGIDAVEVEFTETGRPTFVKNGPSGGNLPAEGSFWIDPERGTVLRTETRFNFDHGHGTATISTQYRFEPGLAMWVPAEMIERYQGLRGQGLVEDRNSVTTGIARYSNFRRFNVTTEEKAALPSP